MFCPNCGAQISEGAGFCSSCGNAVSASPVAAAPVAPAMDYQAMMQAQMLQAQQFQMQKNAVRQSEINTLTNAYNYFNAKRASFAEYDEACEKMNHYSRGAKAALIVLGIICSVFGVFMSMGSLVDGEIPLAVPIILFSLPGAAMLFGGIMLKVNCKRQLSYWTDRYLVLSQELNDYYAAYPQCPVGAEYANPEILELILGVLNSGRADTIKEAINVLIAEVNQAEMNAYLQNIQAYSEQASARAGTAAIFAAASFFS